MAAPLKILAFGDSLTAGYGLGAEEGFAPRLEKKLVAAGYDVAVVNGGVSGDTSSGGVSRLDWMLADRPDFVILELGANDMLRGIDPALTRRNLETILARLNEMKIPVLLAGMKAFANLGPAYVSGFSALYADLARAHPCVFYPFFMEGVAMNGDLLQEDGLHPNARGVDRIVEGIYPYVVTLIGGPK